MRYLLDTNVWLERLLNQSRSNEVKELFEIVPSDHLCISDFSLHSIGVILFKFKVINAYSEFIEDLFENGRIQLLTLKANQLKGLNEIIMKFDLDFDDAYQYIIAESNSLEIITFDKDFKDTPKGKFDPIEVINIYK